MLSQPVFGEQADYKNNPVVKLGGIELGDNLRVNTSSIHC